MGLLRVINSHVPSTVRPPYNSEAAGSRTLVHRLLENDFYERSQLPTGAALLALRHHETVFTSVVVRSFDDSVPRFVETRSLTQLRERRRERYRLRFYLVDFD